MSKEWSDHKQMKMLTEGWRKFNRVQENLSLIHEEFFKTTDKEFSRPLSSSIVAALASRLPGSSKAQKSEPLKASGAEGIVLSLDDFRVIKLFHSIESAAKNLPLVSKDVPETAQVYSTGTIVLKNPVIYFKKGSSYTPDDAKPTNKLYYIIMQRIKPDPFIYRYVEIAYELFNRLSNVDFDKLIRLYQIEDDALRKRIDEVFLDFMASQDTDENYEGLEDFLSSASKKQFNVTTQNFNQFKKNKTKEFLLQNTNGNPVNLKKLILNFLGIESDLDYDAKKILEFLNSSKEFSRTPKKSFTNNNLKKDLQDIIDLIKKIRIEKKIPWNDIHGEQFGRDKQNKLVALDLGIKSYKDDDFKQSSFGKNVVKISIGKDGIKTLNEEATKEDIEVLNVFDFDLTLFFTHDDENGKNKYEKVFKEKYPHKGWFGREESLSDELEIQENPFMKKIFDAAKKEQNSAEVLISNRTHHLEDRLTEFLRDRGYTFDDILLKKGGLLKKERLEKIWEKYPSVTQINIFDDLDEAIEQYEELKDLYQLWRPDVAINIYQVMPSGKIKKR